MATRKMNFFEKQANLWGAIYRHQAAQFPRRLAILKVHFPVRFLLNFVLRLLPSTSWPLPGPLTGPPSRLTGRRLPSSSPTSSTLLSPSGYVFCLWEFAFISAQKNVDLFRKDLSIPLSLSRLFSGSSLVKWLDVVTSSVIWCVFRQYIYALVFWTTKLRDIL